MGSLQLLLICLVAAHVECFPRHRRQDDHGLLITINVETKQVDTFIPIQVIYNRPVSLTCQDGMGGRVTWYRARVLGNGTASRLVYVPLTSPLWMDEGYQINQTSAALSKVVINSFTDSHEGKYLCLAQATANSSANSSTAEMMTSKAAVLALQRSLPNDDPPDVNFNCTIPSAYDIASPRRSHGRGYVNITLTWNYRLATNRSNWCRNLGDFKVRYSAWRDVHSAPPDTVAEITAFDSFDWSEWQPVATGATSTEFSFISTDLYYLFQVAIQSPSPNPHPKNSTEFVAMNNSQLLFFGIQEHAYITRMHARPSHNVSLGTAVNLTCDAVGQPSPTITWGRIANSDSQTVFYNDMGKLTGKLWPISRARLSDSRRYVCFATNIIITDAGKRKQNDFKTFDLTVYKEREQCLLTTAELCLPFNNGSAWVAGGNVLADYEHVSEQLNATLSREEDGECVGFITELFCRWALPQCHQPRLCRAICEEGLARCAETWKQVAPLLFPLLLPWQDCADLGADNATCDTLEVPPDPVEASDTAPTTSEPSPAAQPADMRAVYGVFGAVAFFVVLIVVLTIAVLYFYHYSRKKKFGELKQIPVDNPKFAPTLKSTNNHYVRRMQLQSISDKDFEKWTHIPQCRINIIEEIGQGHFGVVCKAEVQGLHPEEDTTIVAAKSLYDCETDSNYKLFLHEAKIMFRFTHPNIVRLFGVSLHDPPYYLLFEYMCEGDLNEFLQQRASSELKQLLLDPEEITCSRTESALSNEPSGLTNEQLLFMCAQISQGMAHLAELKHVHRDLATRNCLVGGNLVVKIADFGMSQNLYHSDYYRVQGEVPLPVRWMAPESIMFGKFTSETDVWSFGVVMWEVFSFAVQPYYGHSNEEVCDLVRRGVKLQQPKNCPPKIYELMYSCWAAEPNCRPSMAELCAKLDALRCNKMDSPLSFRDSQSLSSQDSNVFETPSPSPGPCAHIPLGDRMPLESDSESCS